MSPTSETISRPNLMDMAPANQLLPRVQNFCPRTSLGWDCVLLCCAVLCCAVLCCISMYCVVTPIHFLSAQIHLLSLRFSSHLFSSPLLSPAQPVPTSKWILHTSGTHQLPFPSSQPFSRPIVRSCVDSSHVCTRFHLLLTF